LGKHRNIVGLHDVLFLKDETIMLMDIVEGGELFDYIVDMGSISERDASRLLFDVCSGIEYIHSMGVWYEASVHPLIEPRMTEFALEVAIAISSPRTCCSPIAPTRLTSRSRSDRPTP
jgi:serine/threonine protein kinase